METQTAKRGTKEDKLSEFSSNSRSYRVYAENVTVMESRNVMFVAPPQGVRRTRVDEKHRDELAGRARTKDVMDYI